MIYLAQPYSYKANAYLRHKRYEYAMKRTVEFFLEGHAIFSPIIQSHQMSKYADMPTDFDFWRKIDFAFIDASKEVWVLKMKGWDKSQGVTEEIAYAKSLNKPIKYIQCPDSPKEESKPDLTQRYLKECLDYSPESGLFVWKTRPLNHFKDEKAFKIWNIKYAGKTTGNTNSHGYCRIILDQQHFMAHRLAFLYMMGDNPEKQIDHIDHNRSNNVWINLRIVDDEENKKNLGKAKNNKSGVTGVCWSNRDSRWIAQIQVKGENIGLGYYKDFFEAVCARKRAEVFYKFHENHGFNAKEIGIPVKYIPFEDDLEAVA